VSVRWTSRVGIAVTTVIVVGSLWLSSVPPRAVRAAKGTTPDVRSSAITFRTAEGWFAAPIHAVLLPDGRGLLVGIARSPDGSRGSGDPEDPRLLQPIAFVMRVPTFGPPLPFKMRVDTRGRLRRSNWLLHVFVQDDRRIPAPARIVRVGP
jgi:hypothetical protein